MAISKSGLWINIENAKVALIHRDASTGAITYDAAWTDLKNLASISIEPDSTDPTILYGDGQQVLKQYPKNEGGTITASFNWALDSDFYEKFLGYVKTYQGEYVNRKTNCKPEMMFYFEQDLSSGADCKPGESRKRKWLFADVSVNDLTLEGEQSTDEVAENPQEIVFTYSASEDPDWKGHSFSFIDYGDLSSGVFDIARYLQIGKTPAAPKLPTGTATVTSGTTTVALTNIPATATKVTLIDLTTGTSTDKTITVSSNAATLSLTTAGGDITAGHSYEVVLGTESLATFTAQ